jgi:hypothetical protein
MLLRSRFAVMLDMVLGGLIAVLDSPLRVAMRDQRLVRGVGVVLLGVMSGGLAMMLRRLLMMACCRVVMLRARKCFAHAILHLRIPGCIASQTTTRIRDLAATAKPASSLARRSMSSALVPRPMGFVMCGPPFCPRSRPIVAGQFVTALVHEQISEDQNSGC